ncbi:TetR family transcriptional regulator [Bacillus sp. 0909A]|uniref:TetR family transcriptional regulator n=1 Tax=Bacillus sp. 0909A TaxID=3120561 RepID=UPI002FDB3A03
MHELFCHFRLMRLYGFQSVTIKDIASAASVSELTIYRKLRASRSSLEVLHGARDKARQTETVKTFSSSLKHH